MVNFTGSNYPTGLDMLSHTITFFRENPVLPPDLAKTNELMAMLDLKYLPSALYRIRRLAFASGTP